MVCVAYSASVVCPVWTRSLSDQVVLTGLTWTSTMRLKRPRSTGSCPTVGHAWFVLRCQNRSRPSPSCSVRNILELRGCCQSGELKCTELKGTKDKQVLTPLRLRRSISLLRATKLFNTTRQLRATRQLRSGDRNALAIRCQKRISVSPKQSR